MQELYNLDISENTIKSMVEVNNEILELTSDEVIMKELILENVNCSKIQIRNIISSNPLYLSRTNDGVIELFNTFYKFGFGNLNILLDSNPYILNLDSFEIEDYVNERINNGELLEDIIDDLESNSYLFNEM